jgi:hypothetical protein
MISQVTVECSICVKCPVCGIESSGTFYNPVHNLPEILSVLCRRCEIIWEEEKAMTALRKVKKLREFPS